MNVLAKLTFQKITPKTIKNLPEMTGVYIFCDTTKKPIYVGKAKNLKNRVGSYFQINLHPKTKKMISLAKYIAVVVVNSEVEALLLEANLVKLYKPNYNIELKDDKHPLYIKITNDTYPLVLTVRKAELTRDTKYFFGPFPSSQSVRDVLKIARRLFPYSQHKPTKRVCIYRQIGLCVPCPSEIANTANAEERKHLQNTYLHNIRQVKRLLDGKVGSVRSSLVKDMYALSKKAMFEKANVIKAKIASLDYITQPVIPPFDFLLDPQLTTDVRQRELSDLAAILKPLIKLRTVKRIECYDIAHLAGTKPSASMVTFIDAVPDKAWYRHFRITQPKGSDDVASLAEVAKRRLKHLSDWGEADLIIVDGGKGQVAAFAKHFQPLHIPVVGLAKRFETLVIPLQEMGSLKYKEIRPKGPAKNLVMRIRDEAHRFARRYHHLQLSKDLLTS